MSILDSCLRIIQYVLGLFYNRSKSTNVTTNNQLKVNTKESDSIKSIINKSLETGDLDELRKKIAEK